MVAKGKSNFISVCFSGFKLIFFRTLTCALEMSNITNLQRMLFNWCLIQSLWKFSFLRWIVIWSLFIALSQYYIKQMHQWLSGSFNNALSCLLKKKHTKHIKHMHDIISEVKTPKKHTKHIKHMCQWLSGSCYSILSIEEEKKHIKHVKHMHGIISEVWNKKKHTKHIGHWLSGFGNIALSCLLKKNT